MRRLFLRWLVCLMLMPSLCYPQALPSVMQKAVSGVLQKKLASRGFASNDPRWGATLQSAGSSIAGAGAAAAVVTLAGVTAPAWITAAATVVLGSLFAYGIDLAVDAFANWKMNSDGTVTRTVQQPPAGPVVQGQVGYHISTNTSCIGSSPLSAASTCIPRSYTFSNGDTAEMGTCVASSASGGYTCTVMRVQSSGYRQNFASVGVVKVNSAPGNCPSGQVYNAGSCIPEVRPAAQPVTQTATQAVQALTPEELAKPANPHIIASLADSAWRAAASQPDYKGFPYDETNPVSGADAVAWQQANPAHWPTVGDVVKPAPVPEGGVPGQQFALPNSAAEPGPGSTGDKPPPPPNIDPALDWAIPATAEKVPSIAAPLTFTPTVFAAPTGCPAPLQYQLLGEQRMISYEPFCDLMRSVAPIFLALGAAAAALIFVSSLKS